MAKAAKKEKAVNYTAEQVAILTEGYTGADNKAEVAALAEKTGKTPASIRAKLASLGIYKAEKAAEGDESERVTKRVIAEAIAEKANLTELETDGLEKATKAALEKVLAKLA